ncbi:MAG: DUF1430 domain-containing protein [Oscillospiraceae bacterium]|jgi:hypothetical protein|nr:DUF1430 domain-containing protein [Oscillospiraceae bacterium]
MKSIKLTVTVVLILIASILTGDLFQDYLSHFEYTFDCTTFALPFKVNGAEMTDDLLKIATKNNIRFFTVQHEHNGLAKENITLYCSDASIAADVKSLCGVEVGEYRSVFFGKTIVATKAFTESADELLTGEYLLLGNDADIFQFKMDLMEKYGGGLPHDGYNPSDDATSILCLWLAVAVVFLLLSLFEYSLKQKEFAVLLSIGVNPLRVAMQNAAIDTFVLLTCYGVVRLVLPHFTNTDFEQQFSIFAIVVMVVVDCFVWARLFRLNLQATFKGNTQQTILLRSTLIAKHVSSALAMLLVGANCVLIAQSVSFWSQKPFWDKYASYNQLYAQYVSDDESRYDGNNGSFSPIERLTLDTNYSVYSQYFKQADAMLMAHVADKSIFGSDLVAYNQNASAYLQSVLPDISFSKLEQNRVFLLLPAKKYEGKLTQSTSEALQNTVNYLMDWDGGYTDGAETLYYENAPKLIALASGRDFEVMYYESPIIIFVNIDESLFPRINTGDDNIGSNIKFTMYNMSKTELKAFFEKNNPGGYDVQAFAVNVGDQYAYRLAVLQKAMYITFIVSGLFLLLNLLISFVATRLEYSVNAVELALKKVHGYGFLERQRRLLTSSAFSSALGIVLASIASIVFRTGGTVYVLLVGILFLSMDLAVILLFAYKTEQTSIIKILKGGAL